MAPVVMRENDEIRDPPLARFLFSSTKLAPVWLVLRVFLGYQWVNSGWGKINDPKWMETDEALQGYWVNAVKIPDAPARPAITFDWYRSFLQTLLDAGAYTWFAKLIAVALIIGLFTAIAAFFGGFMNWNFMMAGSASSNPLLFTVAIALIMAWKVAGFYGLDRFVLPALGTPWQAGPLVKPDADRPAATLGGPAVRDA